MSNTVKIIDNLSSTTLFETHIDNIDHAYKFAAELEDQGLDIRLESDGVALSLLKTMGATEDEIISYNEELKDEIDSHLDDSCAFCKD